MENDNEKVNIDVQPVLRMAHNPGAALDPAQYCGKFLPLNDFFLVTSEIIILYLKFNGL